MSRQNDDSPQHDPAYRLESLRFFAAERDGFPVGLDAWMQEVEKQIANLRERLNALPSQFAQKEPRW